MRQIVFLSLQAAILCVGCGTERESSPRAAQAQSAAQSSAPKLETTQERQPLRKPAPKIETLVDFEASTFCTKYQCKRDGSWKLRAGGENNTFETTLSDVAEEVQTANGRVVGFGLSFYERARLRSDDLIAIETLLRSVDNTAPAQRAVTFIKENAERSAFQIEKGRSMRYGAYTLRAAKIGSDQTVSLDRSVK